MLPPAATALKAPPTSSQSESMNTTLPQPKSDETIDIFDFDTMKKINDKIRESFFPSPPPILEPTPMSTMFPDYLQPNLLDDLAHFPRLSSSEDTEEPKKDIEEPRKQSPVLDYEKVKTIQPCKDFTKQSQ